MYILGAPGFGRQEVLDLLRLLPAGSGMGGPPDGRCSVVDCSAPDDQGILCGPLFRGLFLVVP